jgi:ABC-type enterobactin transport system permease subunit
VNPVNPRLRIVLIGAAASAVLGGAAAWAIAQARQSQSEQAAANATLPANHLRHEPAPGQYVAIAVTLVMLVRQIVELFQSD